MKSNLKIKLIILVIFFVFLSGIITSNLNFKNSEFSNSIDLDDDNLTISTVSEPIYINDYDPSSSWSVAKDMGFCTGNGTFSEPYIIEDLVIDGGGWDSCILINNSKVYFKIENCTVYNSGSEYPNAGIKLQSVSNGSLINNNVLNNNDGIYLEDSDNNTISGNTANNYGIGIYLRNSRFNNVSGNIMNECGLKISVGNLEILVSNDIDTTNLVNGKPLYYYTNEVNLGPNDFMNAGQVILVNCNDSLISNLNVSYTSTGISLYYCNNNTISGNTANNNYGNGIFLYYSNNTTIERNTAKFCGILLINSDNNTILGNTANNNSWAGILLVVSDNNDISGNTANYNDYVGIDLTDSDNNDISGNTANNNGDNGISLGGSNNTISGNTANNNGDNGISLGGSNNTISGNMMNKCGLLYTSRNLEILVSNDIDTTNLVNGKPLYYYTNEVNLGPNDFMNAGQVILVNCNDSLISNLNVSYTSTGISLYYCNNNTISGNTANYNNYIGIYLRYSDNNNIISGNSANNNIANGIWLISSNNNIISGNTANNNIANGIRLSVSDNNDIMGNTINNNYNGIYLKFSDSNTISGNIVNKHSRYGIYFRDHCDNNNIYLNCFTNNTINARDSGWNNLWDNGMIGNYWSDYTGFDADNNGIGDEPYNITGSAGSQDNFPLMNCTISAQDGGGIPIELIILISVISGGAMIGVATLILIRHKRKRIE